MIRDRFEQTREAVTELATIQALIWAGGDDWKPETPGKPQTSDPTANKAIYNVDMWAGRLDDLRKREEYLIEYIGQTLEIIEAVRDGLGIEYAQVLDGYYIDGATWRQVSKEYGLSVSSCKRKRDIACDWVDSLGVSRVIGGEYEL